MTSSTASQTFCDELLRLTVTEPSLIADSIVWADARLLPDDSIVVVYRTRSVSTTFGRRYVLSEFASMFSRLSIRDLARIAVTDEITDPTSGGQILPVTWAEGLVDPDTAVRWLGEPQQYPVAIGP